jgi:hypothetical protein
MNSLIEAINRHGGPLVDEDELPEGESINFIRNYFSEQISDNNKKSKTIQNFFSDKIVNESLESELPRYYIHYDPSKRNFVYEFPELMNFGEN